MDAFGGGRKRAMCVDGGGHWSLVGSAALPGLRVRGPRRCARARELTGGARASLRHPPGRGGRGAGEVGYGGVAPLWHAALAPFALTAARAHVAGAGNAFELMFAGDVLDRFEAPSEEDLFTCARLPARWLHPTG